MILMFDLFKELLNLKEKKDERKKELETKIFNLEEKLKSLNNNIEKMKIDGKIN